MSILDANQICRLCCTIKRGLRSVFDQRQKYPLPLSELIYAIADLKVTPNDGLPQKICRQCVFNLLKMYEDIQSYRENDLFLKKQLNKAEPNGIEDMREVDKFSIKQEVVEDEPKPESESKPTHDTDEKQDGTTDDERMAAELDISIKNETLDEDDEKSKLCVTETNVVAKKTTSSQQRRCHWKCYICKSESHETASVLLVHLNSNHKDLLPFTCPDCVMETVVLKTLLKLNRHFRQHSYRLKCPYCDKRFPAESKLGIHIQTHQRSTKDDCDQRSRTKCHQCKEHFSCNMSMVRHVQSIHCVSTPMKSCKICGIVLDSMSQLRTHLQEQHGRETIRFDCSVCQKKYSTLRTLESHIRAIHSYSSQKPKKQSKQVREKNHASNRNQKAKRDISQYYTRMADQDGRMRGKGMRNLCETCGERFTRPYSLKRHLVRYKGHKAHSVQSNALNGEQRDADKPKQVVEDSEADAEVSGLIVAGLNAE